MQPPLLPPLHLFPPPSSNAKPFWLCYIHLGLHVHAVSPSHQDQPFKCMRVRVRGLYELWGTSGAMPTSGEWLSYIGILKTIP